jgi:hypothetical protein
MKHDCRGATVDIPKFLADDIVDIRTINLFSGTGILKCATKDGIVYRGCVYLERSGPRRMYQTIIFESRDPTHFLLVHRLEWVQDGLETAD